MNMSNLTQDTNNVAKIFMLVPIGKCAFGYKCFQIFINLMSKNHVSFLYAAVIGRVKRAIGW